MEAKVIDPNRCIACGACVDACEHRWGSRRLEPLTTMVGGFLETGSCRVCSDNPPCVQTCKPMQALKLIEGRVTVFDNCVGCGNCQPACPYDAVRFIAAPPPPPPEPAPPKKKAEKDIKIASICNWCAGFNDLACVSACPTGALLVLLVDEPGRTYDRF